MPKHHWNWGFSLFGPNVARMKAKRDVEGLVEACDYGSGSVCQQAEQALIELGDLAVEPLIFLLNTGDTDLRRKAVSGLAKCKTTRAIEALCGALKDADGYVRLLAMRALEEKADARAVAPLIKTAQDAKASVHVQTILRFVLDRAAASVTSEDLRQAVQLNDSYVLIFAQVDTSCTFRIYNVTSEECDFTQIKQMARQELIRRGLDA